MNLSIYEYLDYQKYLSALIESRPARGRGDRKRMAEVLNCQMAFITHVFNKDKDFNHEQILKIASYFNLNEPEKEFLVEMLSYNRAGTKELKEFYKRRLLQRREQYKLLKNRLQETQSLAVEDQAQYYSHWLYGAVHMASTVPSLQSVDVLSNYFRIAENELHPVLEFLASKGIVYLQNGKLLPGKTNLHVEKDSPLANQNHCIWRLKALHDLNSTKTDDFHYSLCFSISHSDWPIVREKMLVAINDCLQVIRPSKEEKLGLLCVDFQEV